MSECESCVKIQFIDQDITHNCLLEVLFGGKQLSSEQRYSLRDNIVFQAIATQIRPLKPTKQLSDRELIMAYLQKPITDLTMHMPA